MKRMICLALLCIMLGTVSYSESLEDMNCSVSELLDSISVAANLDPTLIRPNLEEDIEHNSLMGQYGVYHYTLIINPITRKVCGISISLDKTRSSVLLVDAATLYKQWMAAIEKFGIVELYNEYAGELDTDPATSWNYTNNNYDKTIYANGYVFEFRSTDQWATLLVALKDVEQKSQKQYEFKITENTAKAYADALLDASESDCIVYGAGYYTDGSAYGVPLGKQTIVAGMIDGQPTDAYASLTVYANEAAAIKETHDIELREYFETPETARKVFRYNNAVIAFYNMNTQQQAELVTGMITTWNKIFE